MSKPCARGVRHRLLAIDVLARVAGIHHHPLVPVIGHRRHDAVDVLAVEQFLVAARSGQARIARDLSGQRVTAVVQVGGGDALDAGK